MNRPFFEIIQFLSFEDFNGKSHLVALEKIEDLSEKWNLEHVSIIFVFKSVTIIKVKLNANFENRFEKLSFKNIEKKLFCEKK
jgi:hypothetical protein